MYIGNINNGRLLNPKEGVRWDGAERGETHVKVVAQWSETIREPSDQTPRLWKEQFSGMTASKTATGV